MNQYIMICGRVLLETLIWILPTCSNLRERYLAICDQWTTESALVENPAKKKYPYIHDGIKRLQSTPYDIRFLLSAHFAQA